MKPQGFLRLQQMKWMLSIVLALELAAGITGCGGSAAPPPPPVPSIVSLSPASATAGQAPFTLTVNGATPLLVRIVWRNAAANCSHILRQQYTTDCSRHGRRHRQIRASGAHGAESAGFRFNSVCFPGR